MRRAGFPVVVLTFALLSSACELLLGEIPPETLESSDAGLSADSGPPVTEIPIDAHEDESVDPPADDDDTPSAGEDDASEGDEDQDACTRPVDYYADEDGDGFGVGEPWPTCENPGAGWARKAGDCADDEPRVYPGQKKYFGEPFVRTNGVQSYDYDCSGNEEGNPAQALEPSCETVRGPQCSEAGYTRTERSGKGLNAYCGSVTLEACMPTVTVVFCKSTLETTSTPYACR